MTTGPKPHAVLRPGSRLWPVFCLLRDRGQQGATSLEMAEAFGDANLNISTTAADIRKVAGQYGYEMLPAEYQGKRGEGASARKLYRYRLVRLGAEQPTPAAPAPAPAAAQPVMAMGSSRPGPAPAAPQRDLFGDSGRVKW